MSRKNLIVIALFIILVTGIIWLTKFLPEKYTAPVNDLMPSFLAEETPSAQRELSRKPITFTIAIKNNRFVPDRMEIKIGDTIRWVNEDETLHWIASDPHPTHTNLPSLDSLGEIQKSESYSYTFKKEGVFTYHDHAAALQELGAAKGAITVKK